MKYVRLAENGVREVWHKLRAYKKETKNGITLCKIAVGRFDFFEKTKHKSMKICKNCARVKK
jgi:hypothetical protein